MNQILVWPLSDTLKINFSSPACDLGSITCCDLLTITLLHKDQSFIIARDVVGCDIANFKQLLQQLIAKQQVKVQFKEFFHISMDQCDNALLEILRDGSVFCYQVVPVDMVQAWIAQLDLLHVLMEENENEKKIRGKGCC